MYFIIKVQYTLKYNYTVGCPLFLVFILKNFWVSNGSKLEPIICILFLAQILNLVAWVK